MCPADIVRGSVRSKPHSQQQFHVSRLHSRVEVEIPRGYRLGGDLVTLDGEWKANCAFLHSKNSLSLISDMINIDRYDEC